MESAEGGKKSLRWDEENLEYNEENKTPKMKIDEPPTPFNFDYCDDELVDDEGMKRRAAVSTAQGLRRQSLAECRGSGLRRTAMLGAQSLS
jgi:hypothetical protein